MKYTATLSAVQVGQAVKSLLLLGERKITIGETEKDRFVVTTTTETVFSKKSTNSISRKGVKTMAKLNFYDTDAVKAFVLDILIENAELKSDLDYEKKCSNDWFDRYKKADQQVKDLEAKVATLEGGSENE